MSGNGNGSSAGSPAAEFEVYNGSGMLADCVVDVEVIGPANR